jgi:hypothetical protein
MTGKPGAMFKETTVIPRGRKARRVSAELWEALEDSAARGVAFSRTDTPEAIDQLRRDLTSAAVRARYDVTTETTHIDDGTEKLAFAAQYKTED